LRRKHCRKMEEILDHQTINKFIIYMITKEDHVDVC